jgi:hypothetical protein
VTSTAAARSGKDVAADLAFLTRALKARRCGTAPPDSPSGPGPRRGRTRSTWPRFCNQLPLT